MRQVAAGLIDAAIFAALAFGGFRLALWASPCQDPANCFIQIPLILLFVFLAVGGYGFVSYRLWRSTAGRRLLGI